MEGIKAAGGGGGGHDGGRQCGFHRRLLLTIYTRSNDSDDGDGDVAKMRERISA